jgi:hypothetical protein
MTKKLKHIISILLVLVFLTPMAVKVLDSEYHHHDHFICTAKNEHHFHDYHFKCPIPGFEFSLYSLNKIILVTQKTFYFEKVFTNYISIHCCSKSKYSFALRAPPLNIHD